MPPRNQETGLRDFGLEADGILVRPVGGQIYLVEEGDEAAAPWDDDAAPPDRSSLSGLINRH
jgi:hypothetical protein